jgi:hypothetical protein
VIIFRRVGGKRASFLLFGLLFCFCFCFCFCFVFFFLSLFHQKHAKGERRMRQGIPLVKGQIGFLARARANPSSIVDCSAEHSDPLFVGDPAAYLASIPDEHARAIVANQLRNKVKKCPVCNKPNAYTLATCNGCSNDLTKVEWRCCCCFLQADFLVRLKSVSPTMCFRALFWAFQKVLFRSPSRSDARTRSSLCWMICCP